MKQLHVVDRNHQIHCTSYFVCYIVFFQMLKEMHILMQYKINSTSCGVHAGWTLFLSVDEMCIQPLIRPSPHGKEFDRHLNKANIKCKDTISLWSSKA